MILLSTALCSFAAGLLATLLIERFLSERIAILGSFAGLQRSENAGVAFGMKLPGQAFLIAGALVVVTIVALRTAKTRLSMAGFGLILGGGWANVIDRLLDGKVTDVFQVGTFPVFNVADSCITIGVGFLLLEAVMLRKAH